MGVNVIDLPIKLNYGATIQTGFKYAFRENYDTVVLLEGDGQHNPAYIPRMIGGNPERKDRLSFRKLIVFY